MGITYGTSTLFQATKGIVQDGLVLNLDAGVNKSYPRNGTTWYDLSNNGNGTLTNGPTFSRNNGGVITFDGTDDNVTLGTGGSLGLDSYHSVEFWVYPFTDSGDQGLLRNKGSGGNTNNYMHYLFRGANIHMGWYQNDLKAFNQMVPNNWYHIVFLLDSADDKRRIYKNSSLVATDSSARTTTPNVTNTTTYLGYYGPYFNGLMATCRIYNRSLTATEVLQNYNSMKARFGL